MRLLEVVEASRAVAGSSGRGEKARVVARLLRQAPLDEVPLVTSYLVADVRERNLQVGYSRARGAFGAPAASTSSLSLAEVAGALREVAAASGPGATAARERRLGALFSRATEPEQTFLGRLLVGELRQGALEGVMIEGIALAAGVSPSAVRRALMLSSDLGEVARAALADGAAGLERFTLERFRPLRPMLAQPAAGLAEALEEHGQLALEYKLDGARVQIHRDEDRVQVFSREGNDVTGAVPELVEAARALPARTCVLDGEAIALDGQGRPLAFQDTMKRFGRRLNVARLRAQLPLSVALFDLLELDGRTMLEAPASERRTALVAIAGAVSPSIVVPQLVTSELAEADRFYAEGLGAGHEGLVAKSLSAPYEAGRRGAHWLKVKPAHTLDLIVLAAEWGSGRREGFLSNLHLGARDPATGALVMLGKTFKGMTDELLAWQTQWCLAHEVSRDAQTVYVTPELVAEIALDGVQRSSQYPGGVALRFARLRRYRPDKSAAQADTVEAVRALARP